MKTYSFIYSEPDRKNKFVLLSSAIFLGALLVLLIGFKIFELIPVWLIMVLFFPAYLGSLWYISKMGSVDCLVTKTGGGLLIELSKSNFLYKEKEIIIHMSGVKKIAADKNFGGDQSRYFTISLLKGSKKIRLQEPVGMSKDDLAEFSDSINTKVNEFNESTFTKEAHKGIADTTHTIQQGSIYDSIWAKLFTILLYLALIIFTLVWISGEDIRWYKALQFYGLSFLWLGGYHTNRKKK